MKLPDFENLPYYSWENIKLDTDLGTVEGTIEPRHLVAYEFAVGSDGAWYQSPTGTANQSIVNPLLLVNDIVRLFHLGFDCRPGYQAGLHARNVVRLYEPLTLGTKVSLSGRFTDKFWRRGIPYRTLSGEVTDSAGNKLIEVDALESIGYERTHDPESGELKTTASGQDPESREPPPEEPWPRITGETRESARRARPLDAQVDEGALLEEVSRKVGLEESIIFSGFPFNWASETPVPMRRSVHTEHEIAAASGFDLPLIQGLISANHIAEVVGRQFGESWLRTGRLDTKFVASALVGEQLTSQALVRKKSDGPHGTQYELDAWTKGDGNRLVTVARASLTV